MEAVAQFIASQGGWGAWLLTIGWFIYLFSTGKLISLREHQARVEDLKERLKDEQDNSEFWREAATLSTEMGAIITKAKVSLERRQNEK